MQEMELSPFEAGIKAIKGDKAFETMEMFFNNCAFGDYGNVKECLAEDVEYISDYQGCTIKGKEAVWRKLAQIAFARRYLIDAVPAVISESSENDSNSGFTKGTPCLALKYAEYNTVKSLALIKGNADGQVQMIRIADVGEKEFHLCPRPGWKGFRARIICEERRFDSEGKLINTICTYMDGSPAE